MFSLLRSVERTWRLLIVWFVFYLSRITVLYVSADSDVCTAGCLADFGSVSRSVHDSVEKSLLACLADDDPTVDASLKSLDTNQLKKRTRKCAKDAKAERVLHSAEKKKFVRMLTESHARTNRTVWVSGTSKHQVCLMDNYIVQLERNLAAAPGPPPVVIAAFDKTSMSACKALQEGREFLQCTEMAKSAGTSSYMDPCVFSHTTWMKVLLLQAAVEAVPTGALVVDLDVVVLRDLVAWIGEQSLGPTTVDSNHAAAAQARKTVDDDDDADGKRRVGSETTQKEKQAPNEHAVVWALTEPGFGDANKNANTGLLFATAAASAIIREWLAQRRHFVEELQKIIDKGHEEYGFYSDQEGLVNLLNGFAGNITLRRIPIDVVPSCRPRHIPSTAAGVHFTCLGELTAPMRWTSKARAMWARGWYTPSTPECQIERAECVNFKHLRTKSGNVLQWAVKTGHLPVVKHVADGASIADLRRWHSVALDEAARLGDLSIVQTLLNDIGGAAGNAIDMALRPAVASGEVDVVELLLARRAQPNVDALRTAVKSAYTAKGGPTAVVEMLLAARADPNDGTVGTEDAEKPLVAASMFGHMPIVRLLVDSAKVSAGVARDATMQPLHAAGICGHLQVAQFLVERGAPVNGVASDSGAIPLHGPAQWCHDDVVAYLLKQGATLSYDDLLHGTARRGCWTTVETLILARANVDGLFRGDSPLHATMIGGHVRVAGLLLHHGASVNIANRHGMQPLHTAAAKGHLAAVMQLVENRADVRAKAKAGTPLMAARQGGNAEVVQYLRSNNAA